MGYRHGWLGLMMLMLGAPTLTPAAFKYFDPSKSSDVPLLLSQTGFYTNIANRITDTAAKAFTVNSPLWSDGSLKKRWVILPKGKKIPWVDDTDYFNYPDSTVLVKNFLHVRAPGDTMYWETRFLVKKTDTAEFGQNWWGFSYRWNATQTDADLVAASGANATLAVKDDQGRTTYKKWRFPSVAECRQCHQVYSGPHIPETGPVEQGRGVLGFYPAQIKRPTQNGASDQVLDLFTSGVFSGTKPNAASLAKRYIGIAEPIDLSVTEAQRAIIIDNKARSYLGSNCSGCHGTRASKVSVAAARIPPNFDYFDLRQHDITFDKIQAIVSLADTTSYTDSVVPILGRNKYKWLVSSWGLGADPNYKLELPPGNPQSLETDVFYVDAATKKGYPALSYGLFRQWARVTPAEDSATWYRALKQAAGFGDANAQAKLGWIFSKPWGSKEWTDNLATHGLTMDSVMAGWEGVSLYRNDPDGMPPLATYIPDTASLKILAEWVARQGLTSPIRTKVSQVQHTPYFQDRVLVLPADITGDVLMVDIRGKGVSLKSLGKGRYEIPETAKNGFYFFQVGKHYFKASILR